MRPHRWPPTRLPRPWDSPGKNTGVGCHFLLQCKKVKSESEVAQSCLTLSDPMDCSLPGSSVHGIFQARVLEWGAIAFSVSFYRRTQRYCYICSLRKNQDPIPCCTIVSGLLSLTSLIGNCFTLPFGTQGRPRKLNEACLLQTCEGFVLKRAPQDPTWFQFC